jgi:hypothetical protein
MKLLEGLRRRFELEVLLNYQITFSELARTLPVDAEVTSYWPAGRTKGQELFWRRTAALERLTTMCVSSVYALERQRFRLREQYQEVKYFPLISLHTTGDTRDVRQHISQSASFSTYLRTDALSSVRFENHSADLLAEAEIVEQVERLCALQVEMGPGHAYGVDRVLHLQAGAITSKVTEQRSGIADLPAGS